MIGSFVFILTRLKAFFLVEMSWSRRNWASWDKPPGQRIVFNGVIDGNCWELGLNIYPQSCAVVELPDVAPWPVEWTAASVSPGWYCPAAGTSPSLTFCAAHCGLSRSWYREGWVHQALLLLPDSLWLVYDYVPFCKDKFFHDFLAICASEI